MEDMTERRTPLLEKVYFEGCPGCKQDRKKAASSGIPYTEFFYVWIVTLCTGEKACIVWMECATVSPLDSTAWLGARIGSLLLGSSKVGMFARHAKQRVDKWQCAGTVGAQVEREVDLAVANRCKEADARNQSIWPSMARRNREPWHAAGACNAAYGRMQQNGLFRPKPMEQNHGQHKGAGWL
ncbi:hypothetical protein ZIOFF_050737 [Zingiber officinale]|uniref:Uncharacterized protein n=1 Tax=Zingiber officinale TaxID=94328 RepID=A0A8J5KTU2_ZINOF|nr:hypothetical protein ZIOFF_050737 [Zingiber officinale]